MRVKPREAAIAAQKASENGRYVFIYNNLLTNQVVYSLTQSMRNKHALEQLAYFGKKTVPAKLRKDVWAPLASVTFPHTNQGLDAFRKLREYRRLRDVTWDREAEGMPPEKKRRKQVLMDQKATSIADLAAILHRQEKFGSESLAEAQRVRAEHDAKAVEEQRQLEAELQNLAKRARNGEIAELEAQIANLSSQTQGIDSSDALASQGEERRKLEQKILGLRQLKNSMKRADEAVQAGTVSDIAKKQVTRRIIDRALVGQAPKDILREQSLIDGSWPPPRFGRRRILSIPKPVTYYTVSGVRIAWSNVLDTEYAESWPAAVQHTHMGFTRHTAASPDQPPQMEVSVRRGSPADENAFRMRKRAEAERKEEERKAARRARRTV
ncbi:MAG: hypothetical protein M1821_000166 [Bathelium mastoideum]|nr:MAG: hypothetical protein M1821_000166 [Bathelium mastoideum]KAI9687800.1 MAG: hypothetical protein M1822_001880 [Bathelium mastoideum]